jgi:hypothetical protein
MHSKNQKEALKREIKDYTIAIVYEMFYFLAYGSFHIL